MLNRPSYKEYLRLLVTGWGEQMGGALQTFIAVAVSIGLLALGTFFAIEQSTQGLLVTAATALGALHVTSYKLWRSERQDACNLDERVKPQLRCTFSKDITGCQIWTPMFAITPQGQRVPAGEAKYFRLCVETVGVSQVLDCQATLTRVSRDGVTLFERQSIGLHIANSDPSNPRSKNIRNQVPEYVDVFLITKTNKVVITTPGFEHPGAIYHETLFTGPGHYLFSVVVSSPSSPSIPIDIELRWTGSVETATAAAADLDDMAQ